MTAKSAKTDKSDNRDYDIIRDRPVHPDTPDSDTPIVINLRSILINFGVALVLLAIGLVYAYYYQKYQLREQDQIVAFNNIKKKCGKDPTVVIESHSLTGKVKYTMYTSVSEKYETYKSKIRNPLSLTPEFVEEYYCTPAEAHARHADLADDILNYKKASDIDTMEVDMVLLRGNKFYGPDYIPDGYKVKIKYLNSITTPTMVFVPADEPDGPTEAEKNHQRRDPKTYVKLECPSSLLQQSSLTDKDLAARPAEYELFGLMPSGGPVFRKLPGKKDNPETYGTYLRVNLPAASCQLNDPGKLLSGESALAVMQSLRELSRDEAVEWAKY